MANPDYFLTSEANGMVKAILTSGRSWAVFPYEASGIVVSTLTCTSPWPLFRYWALMWGAGSYLAPTTWIRTWSMISLLFVDLSLNPVSALLAGFVALDALMARRRMFPLLNSIREVVDEKLG